jgi:hypothetical protein
MFVFLVFRKCYFTKSCISFEDLSADKISWYHFDWCNCFFHTNCANNSSSFTDNTKPWDFMSCRYQKHARHQEKRARYLEQELESAREEIKKLKVVNDSSNFVEQGNFNAWCKPRNSRSQFHRFSAADASEVK